MAKQTIKSKYEALKAAVLTYREAVNSRRAVMHSQTPMSKTTGDVKGNTTVTVAELLTVVRTANSLRKHVVLEAAGDYLQINLVDQYPSMPIEFYSE